MSYTARLLAGTSCCVHPVCRQHPKKIPSCISEHSGSRIILDFSYQVKQFSKFRRMLKLGAALLLLFFTRRASGLPVRFRARRISTPFYVRLESTATRDEHGTLCCRTAMVDITVQKQAEAEVHTLNAALEQRVIERTVQLEDANDALLKEIVLRCYAAPSDISTRHNG